MKVLIITNHREMKFKITLTCHLIPIQMAHIQKIKTPRVAKGVKKREPVYMPVQPL